MFQCTVDKLQTLKLVMSGDATDDTNDDIDSELIIVLYHIDIS